MLRRDAQIKRVFLITGRTDMRRGIDSLVSIVRLTYGLDPIEKGTLFLFCGIRKNKIKGLLYEGLSADFCYPNNCPVYVEK